MTKTLLIVGIDRLEALENSYRRAFLSLGWQVEFWDLAPAWRRNVRGGRLGYYFSQFVRVEPWLRKANRELVLRALALAARSHPDLHTSPGDAWRTGADSGFDERSASASVAGSIVELGGQSFSQSAFV